MTLTELLPMVRQLSAPDKLKLIRILAEELDTSDIFEKQGGLCNGYLASSYNWSSSSRY